ncbi:pre-mRNA-splicing factor CWC22 homolog isoform X1 [Vigna umbellata]|uniref:pre-mRNA-splicing factor CWC22 homolog isoform X1 n=1 Tax=Vigna umbellata TaxID=87088 RepID=UPI001F5F4F4F|nr:pre-mRNA-splicing factor CWC22 homolog isoform X1 [Vigna umbellata]
MARRRSSSSESSEDDERRRSGCESEDEERDRYRRGGRSGRKSSGHRRDNSDGSNSGEEINRAERDGVMGSDKKSRSRERKEKSESSEEEGQIVNKKRVSEEKGKDERLSQDYDGRGGRDAEEDSRGDRASRRVNGQSERRGEKESHRLHHRDRWRGEKESHRLHHRDRWRGGEEGKSRIVDRRGRHDSEEDHIELTRKSDGYSDRDKRRKVEKGGNRHSRYDSEEDDRELARKSERDSDRRRRRPERDDDNERNHRDKGVSKQQEESRKKENGNGRTVRDANPQRQTTIPGGNLNGDASNLGKSGGVYIPPFKMAMMMKEVQDKSSVEYQRLTWDALRKSINGLVNKVNATNIKNIIPELFSENLIRGRGLFCRSCMKSQMASPGFTDVFAALVAVVNTKFPEVGDLLLRRIVLQLKRAYKRNDKPQLLAAVKFIGHLVNQQVAHEIIALELLTVLLEKPTDDSVEVAVGFVTECGSILQDLSPKGLHGIFERFRGILHEGEIDKRVQFLIEGLFAIRKAKFQGYPAVRPELDLVEQEDQLTHEVSLDEEIDPEISLDIFKPDPNFLENEKRYEELKKSMLGEESEDEEEGMDAESDDEDEEDESDEEDEEQMQIKDETETNLVNLRRTIYLTIMSSVDFEEAGHKLLKIKLEPGQEMELCIMLLECCSQERTYLRYYGLLGQRFCMINKVHQENFEKCFVQQYSMIHRLETNKLRNVAKFFAHLLGTDALPWHVLSYIRLTEEDTTSSSRIFIKILFQELSEHLGIRMLNERLNDPTMQESFESIFPKDNPKNTRFCINFFTSIGLGGLTENLREYLKNMPRLIMQQQKQVSESESDDESGSSASSDSGSSDSDSTSSDESDAEHDRRQRKRRRK